MDYQPSVCEVFRSDLRRVTVNEHLLVNELGIDSVVSFYLVPGLLQVTEGLYTNILVRL